MTSLDQQSQIDNVKAAVIELARIVDGLAWRIGSDEERRELNVKGRIQDVMEGLVQ